MNARPCRIFAALIMGASAAILVGFLAEKALGRDDPNEKAKLPRLGMSAPFACSKIDGFRLYKALPEAVLTADEKLVVYCEPLDFCVKPVEGRYAIHLTEDFRIRRKGEKKSLFSKDAAVDYKTKFDFSNPVLYISTVISIKGLPPGEYVLDLILHDLGDQREPATRSLDFRIKPSPKPVAAQPDEPHETPEKPPASPAPKGRKPPSQ